VYDFLKHRHDRFAEHHARSGVAAAGALLGLEEGGTMWKGRVLAILGFSIAIAGVGWGFAQQQAARNATLTAQDYVEIQQLYARYTHTIDSGENDGEAWADTFTPDGTFTTSVGRKQLAAFAKNWHEKRGGAHMRHWNANLVITPTADGAHGSCYLMMVDTGDPRNGKLPTISSTAQYDDTLVRAANGWRFKKRGFVPSPPSSNSQ
jgi:hypothetical protein